MTTRAWCHTDRLQQGGRRLNITGPPPKFHGTRDILRCSSPATFKDNPWRSSRSRPASGAPTSAIGILVPYTRVMGSTQTSPVKVSAGPLAVGGFREISTAVLPFEMSAPPDSRVEGGADPAVVGRVEGDARGDDGIDGVEDVVGEHHIGGAELGLEVVHGA